MEHGYLEIVFLDLVVKICLGPVVEVTRDDLDFMLFGQHIAQI